MLDAGRANYQLRRFLFFIFFLSDDGATESSFQIGARFFLSLHRATAAPDNFSEVPRIFWLYVAHRHANCFYPFH